MAIDNSIIKTLKEFEKNISEILGNGIVDVILYGSTVTGSFVIGKGDIDFIVFTNSSITAKQKEELFKYHRTVRRNKSLLSQLEGCYYSLDDKKEKITGGVYVGTSELGWKTVSGINHGKTDIAQIRINHFSISKSEVIDKLFEFNWEDVFKELKKQSLDNLSLLDEIDDYAFKLYAVICAARTLYTFENRGFVSKRGSLEWILDKEGYKSHKNLLNECMRLKNPLTENEINEINFEHFINEKEFLEQVDRDMQHLDIDNQLKERN